MTPRLSDLRGYDDEMSPADTPRPLRILHVLSKLERDWRGGIGPYQLQSCLDPGTGSWNDVGLPTDSTTAKVPVTGSCGFFRVTKP